MFQGKVYSYQNINGKENTFEKSFDNYDDYQNFIFSDQNPMRNMTFPAFDFTGLSAFDRYLDNFFNSRMSLGQGTSQSDEKTSLPVDISRYESEARRIEQEENEKQAKKSRLEKAKETLQGYIEKFSSHKKKDERIQQLIKDAQEDMKKIEEELKGISS